MFTLLASIAERRAAARGVANRVEGPEVVLELYLTLTRRLNRARHRPGNSVFSKNYSADRPIDKYFGGVLIKEINYAISRLLCRHWIEQATVPLTPEMIENLATKPGASERLEAAKMMEIVNHLPDVQRYLIVRHFFDGVSVEQAGASIGIKRTKAYEEFRQALDRLRTQLGE